MNLSGKHTVKTIILWIGIATAVLLILGSFLQLNSYGVGVEINPSSINLDHFYGFISLVQESVQWFKP